jgi:1-acyl-sn-glycerol-3-phosphate acyltransferase
VSEAVSPRIADPSRTVPWPRFASTVVHMALHIVLGLAIVALLFPFIDAVRRRRCIRWWSGRVLAILRLRLRIIGPDRAQASATVIDDVLAAGGRGGMLVMNHVSWLDIFIVHSLRPAHFIAKAEIARWPLLGFMVDRTGAVFIERGKRHAVREVNHRVATMIADGELVGMFPEGTTSDGDRLLPFHANLIQPAIDARAPVVAAGIRYRDAGGGPTTATLFVGDIDILQSLLRLARHDPIVAELHLIDAFDTVGATRHALARAARSRIAAALGFDDEAREIADELASVVVVSDLSPLHASDRTPPGTPPDPRDELL